MDQRYPLMRMFGRTAEDLELDFKRSDRPALVTALLAICATPADPDHWWRQPVSDRTGALLSLLLQGESSQSIALTLCCTEADCGARYEIELPTEALAADSPACETVALHRNDGGALLLRRPTGEDLRRWRALRPASREQALKAMLDSLCLAGEVQPGDEADAAVALAKADPLVAFSVFCACPICGHETDRDIDLEGLALQRLAARQRALLREVHALASAYGWTESEILAVSPARRAQYLDLIEGLA